jgi:hypothetical protein
VTAFGVDLYKYCPACNIDVSIGVSTQRGPFSTRVSSSNQSAFFGIVASSQISGASLEASYLVLRNFNGAYVQIDNLSFVGR